MKTCIVCLGRHQAKTVKCLTCRKALKFATQHNGSSHAGYIVASDGPVWAMLFRDPNATDPRPVAVAWYGREQDAESAARAMAEAKPARGNGHGGVRKKKAA